MPNQSPALHTIPEPRRSNRGWHFLVNHLIQDVPSELAACEFDCRETECSMERWISCERRMQTQRGIEGKPAA